MCILVPHHFCIVIKLVISPLLHRETYHTQHSKQAGACSVWSHTSTSVPLLGDVNIKQYNCPNYGHFVRILFDLI